MNKTGNNIKSYTKFCNDAGADRRYLSDEALQELIGAVEAEPLMRPPKGFRDEVIAQVRQKRRRMKNISLFSYSMKVIAATAAALSIILIVPENIRPEESSRSGTMQEWQTEEDAKKQDLEEAFLEELSDEKDFEEAWLQQRGFLYRFSNRLDEACSKLNGRLNQLVGTEGYY